MHIYHLSQEDFYLKNNKEVKYKIMKKLTTLFLATIFIYRSVCTELSGKLSGTVTSDGQL